MLKKATQLVFFLLAALPYGKGQALPLVFSYGTPGITERGMKVTADEDGNFVLIGDRYSYVDPNGVQVTNVDLEFLKVNARGEEIWYRLLDSTILDGGISILAETGGGYALLAKQCGTVLGGVGCSKQNPRLYRLDGDGNILWYKTYYEGFIGLPASLLKTPDGGYVILGLTSKYSELGDLFLLKVDANGEVVWEAIVTTTGGRAFDVAPSGDGGFYIAGSSIETNGRTALVSKISASGDILWTQYYSRASFTGKLIYPMEDGFGLLLTNLPSDFLDKELFRMDANGALVWEKDLINDVSRLSSAVAATDGVVVAGLDELFSVNDKVGKVVKYDLNGNLVWSKTHNPYPDYYEHPTDIIATENGYAIAGFTELPDTVIYVYPEDLMLFLIDQNGDLDSLETPNAVKATTAASGVLAYPNPVADQVTFLLNSAHSGTHELRLFNALGQSCGAYAFTGQNFRLDRKGLSAGLHFYEIRSQNGAWIAKGKLMLE